MKIAIVLHKKVMKITLIAGGVAFLGHGGREAPAFALTGSRGKH
ncbi:hypothetical protein JEM67_12875 [Serratia sp. PAMC26656]|nr:hypothetical protein [Serratia sp. PAMC26656]